MVQGVSDIVKRLLDRAYAGKAVDALCEEAAAEIERLRDVVMLRLDAALRNGAASVRETDHDAAPAARARTDAAGISRQGTGDAPVTEPMPVVASGSGSVTPVSYEQRTEKRVDWHTIREPLAAGGRACGASGEAATSHGSPFLCRESDESEMHGTDGRPAPTAEPVAWAALFDDGDIAWIGYTPEGAADGAIGRRIVPLYRHPSPCPYVTGTVTRYCALNHSEPPNSSTLTDAEREALATAIDCVRDRLEGFDDCEPTQAALRGLLERLK